MENNLFELATRKKYRFPFNGNVSVEDLWDLTPKQLDRVYKTLSQQVKADGEDSLITPKRADDDLNNMVEIVRHIYAVKEQEAEECRNAAKKAEQRKRIMEILAEKKDQSLRSMSEDDLAKMLSELE